MVIVTFIAKDGEQEKKAYQGVVFYLPIPVLLILVCNRVLVGSIVDYSIIEQLFSDYFGRIKVQAKKISQTFQFRFLGFRENGKTRLGETCSLSAFTTDLLNRFQITLINLFFRQEQQIITRSIITCG